jgi:flavin reductase (DIM6/NTAB) family NADH-FMN oxidoreductase RutF
MSMMDSAEFRRILGHWASGVGIVTTLMPDGRPCGLTASSFASLSLDPFLVLVCVEKNADTHNCIRAAGFFAVSILGNDDERIARRFAASEVDRKFDGLAYRAETTGSPVLNQALGWVDCRVHAEYEGGDHTIFVGNVVAGNATEGSPLLYYRGGYGRFTP